MKCLQLSLTECVRVATAIDMDGSIELGKQKYPTCIVFKPAVRFTNTNPKILNYYYSLLRLFGCKIEAEKKGERWKDRYRLGVRNLDGIEQLLPQIILFLIGKRKQAELLLEYVLIRKKQRSGRRCFGHIEREFQIYDEMKKLNKRGRG